MNILDTNPFTQNMSQLGQVSPVPKAILCVSAHWLTDGTQVLSHDKPRQIFDFYGFPQELYQVRYEPNGDANTAIKIVEKHQQQFRLSQDWGLDHGTWSVLKHMYPAANIPTFQISIDKNKTVKQHFEIANLLRSLRDEGIMIIGSGNLVHNLRDIDWNPLADVKSWAVDFESKALEVLLSSENSNLEKLQNIFSMSTLAKAHPTAEHLIPLIYTLGVSEPDQAIQVAYSGFQNGSISMTSLIAN